MKKTVQRTSKFKAFWGMFALVLVLGAGLFAENLAFVSHAESAAKVTASSAKIRKSADSSSEVIGSAAKDKTISIKSQTKGADGYTWYEVYVDANTLGYIRSDLVSITDGSTPSSSSGTTTTTTTSNTAANTTTSTTTTDSSDDTIDTSQGKYLGRFKLTAYCNCPICCGKWSGGGTASGTTPTPGRTIAMAGVPFGTKLSINGQIYTVEDRGTAYGHVDIFMGSHSQALSFGMKYADVYQVD